MECWASSKKWIPCSDRVSPAQGTQLSALIGAASPYPAYDRWLDTQGVCQSPVSTSCPTFLHHWTCQPGLHPGDHVTRGGQREPEPVPIADGTRGLAPAVTRHHGVPGGRAGGQRSGGRRDAWPAQLSAFVLLTSPPRSPSPPLCSHCNQMLQLSLFPGLDPDAWRGRGAGPGPCRALGLSVTLRGRSDTTNSNVGSCQAPAGRRVCAVEPQFSQDDILKGSVSPSHGEGEAQRKGV
ncbi:uncharacterized protein LOC123612664 isoform X3 [Camelus bactrianus]|uniref:Uncharacterized protein LOC123612664 isoform X3 n=3 Tax=Camelus bactrianus TaxID=9837 RepID=A0AC58Q9U2_CAMBA